MGPRRSTYQLSSGMYISGPPETPKPPPSPSATPCPVPYTGGDVLLSGDHGRMVNLHSSSTSSSAAAAPSSGPIRSSGSLRKSSGHLSQLGPTGLIISGPIRTSGSSAVDESPAIIKKSRSSYGPAVTKLDNGGELIAAGLPAAVVCAVAVVIGIGIAAGVLVLVAVKRPEILVGVGALAVAAAAMAIWNWLCGRKGVVKHLRQLPNTSFDRGNLPVGKLVKATGIITCGSLPLETSYHSVSRCVYVSTELYEYRGWKDKPTCSGHKHFRWGLRYSEKYVADFYISDAESGIRLLVRGGNGAKVSCFVEPNTVGTITKDNKELSPNFLGWLMEHKLSSDGRLMRLEEGYLREGSTASVIGVLQKHQNVYFIDPPEKPVPIPRRWMQCLAPAHVAGIIVLGDRNSEIADYNV